MKMVKSLLLVSAAGLVGVAGAQAADLPVKAKPVEYVKVCSLYGAGFYYIPGTDICMKIGGYVRYQVSTGTSNVSFGPFAGPAGINTRQTGVDVAQRVRATATFDTRQQTAYGTLRTYVLMGYTHDSNVTPTSPVPALYFTRGFIQIAGFTFGKATSFFDFASTAAVAYNAGFLTTSDTGDPGQLVAAYTAQLGNGLSATIAMEESRRQATVWAAAPAGPSGATGLYSSFSYSAAGPTADNLGGAGGVNVASRPDIVGNIRVDQAWGSAQVSAALHDVSAAYYGAPNSTFGSIPGAANTFVEANGHPNDKWGWAVSGGLRLNTPMFGPGDYFQSQVTYTEGAPKYASQSGCGAVNSLCNSWSGNRFAFGFLEDAVFSGTAAAPGTFNLTTAWSVMASYEHFWTPTLRTSIYGSYLNVSHNADANTQICGAFNVPAGTQCNSDWKVWAIGSRSQWNITKDLYVGVDAIYTKLDTATINNGNPVALTSGVAGGGTTTLLPAGKQNGSYQTADQDAWAVTWRVHRDIVP